MSFFRMRFNTWQFVKMLYNIVEIGAEMVKQIKTSLVCSWCFKEALTNITYVGDSIARIECENCNHVFEVSRTVLYSYLLSDWEKRGLTKPVRLAREIKKDPSHFIIGLPFRVMSKPLRMVKELIESCDS